MIIVNYNFCDHFINAIFVYWDKIKFLAYFTIDRDRHSFDHGTE